MIPNPLSPRVIGAGGKAREENDINKKCQGLISFELRVKQNALYVHHLLAVDSASGHDATMREVCMCEGKADKITASQGLLRQTGSGIISDY